jgi:hypothetical protein
MDVSDYGTLSMPPSDDAAGILWFLTEKERTDFDDILRRRQARVDRAIGAAESFLHPEARACFWGSALAEIAASYDALGDKVRALFFMDAAWDISRYPVFAFRTALLYLSVDPKNPIRARTLFQSYLDGYRDVLSRPTQVLINPQITEAELEGLARAARKGINSF